MTRRQGIKNSRDYCSVQENLVPGIILERKTQHEIFAVFLLSKLTLSGHALEKKKKKKKTRMSLNFN